MSAAASWWHCDTKSMGRSAGRSAVAAAAYRFGEKLHDERYDLTHDYTRRHGVLDTFIVAPENAPQWVYDPERLWNEAERAEKRKNSVFARETTYALPSFLTPEERRSIAYEFAAAISARYGVAVSVAIHAPHREGDQRNYHAHLMFTTREITPEGFGEKTRVLDNRFTTGPEEFKKIQAMGADIMNRHLASANSDIRVDARSFEERGVEQEPTIHLGPTDTAKERKGISTERGNINRKVEKGNGQLAEMKAEHTQAEEAIEERKQELAAPPASRDDARERLAGDRQRYARGQQAADRQEKTLPADRTPWGERMLLYVARTAKAMFDRVAALMRLKDPERRQRQQPTTKERRWQSQEQARRQAEKDRGLDL